MFGYQYPALNKTDIIRVPVSGPVNQRDVSNPQPVRHFLLPVSYEQFYDLFQVCMYSLKT
jgi:hypothetical protein